jgi:hypothetical protein
VTAILRAAYHSASRGGDDRALGEEEFRQLDAIRKFLLVIGDGGQDGQFSPLHHTIYCAYLRHKVATDDLAGIDLDQPFTRCLSALAGMSYEAARNSAKAGVSTVREKLSMARSWRGWKSGAIFLLARRRGRVSTPPWRRSRCCPPSLCRPVLRRSAATIWPRRAMPMRYAAPRTIAEAIGWQRDVSCDVLRRYAQSLDLCVDSFVDAFRPMHQSRDATEEDS